MAGEAVRDKVALREKDFGRWNTYTWRTYYEFVRKSGLGLAELGLEKDDRIALIGDNIPELLFVAVGAQALGAISAGLYQSSLPEEISGILNYLGVSIVFCDDQEQVDKLIEIRTAIPQVKKVIYEDSRGMRSYRSDDWFMPIEDLVPYWVMRPMRKIPIGLNVWWIKARRTMSAISV